MSAGAERDQLLGRGSELVYRWCSLNGIELPLILRHRGSSAFDGFARCAYYRDGAIHIWPDACAAIGRAGRQWSYPGYAVDRTPYGVLAHELGHHVEGAHGAWGGIVTSAWRQQTGEAPLTGYCPNDNEWFAEHFRLFVTNPHLLRLLRPKVHYLMLERWRALAEERRWEDVLAGAERQIAAARNKIRRMA